MRDQEIIGLWEAYQQVHAQPEEVEQLDEQMVAPNQPNPHPALMKIPYIKDETPSQKMNRLEREVRRREYLDASTDKKSTQVAHYDLFDVIKGHLLDEGYADTNKAALAIMANMSEEWKQSIIEDVYMGPPKKPPGDSGTETPKKPGMETPNKQKPFEKNPPMSAPELGFDTSDPIINYRRGYYPDGSRVPSPKVPRSAPAPKPGPRGRVY